jgi:hypothetical protein
MAFLDARTVLESRPITLTFALPYDDQRAGASPACLQAHTV